MTLTLYECKPMDARISEKQCKKNRAMQDNPAIGIMKDSRCKGCAGLGEPTKINVEEIAMGTKGKSCIADGCTTASWKHGYCWKHHPDHAANKKYACADKQAIRDIHKAAVVTFTDDQVRVIEPVVASNHEIHVVNLIDVFKQKQAAELDVFICELSKLTEPVDKLLYAYQMVKI